MSDTKQPRVPPHVRNALESLRGRVIDIEANANAAAESLDRVPYLPRLPRHPRPDVKPEWTEAQRRDLGRMQSLVYATADVAQALLAEYHEILVTIGVEEDPGTVTSGAATTARTRRGSDAPDGGSAPTAAKGAADVPFAAAPPDPRPSLGRLVVDFRPLPPEENADGVVTLVVEDIATRPCHPTPAEHEAALLAGAKTAGDDTSPGAEDDPAGPAPHCS